MADLREWFTSEIHRLGFAGLEGVYDYLASMPDEEARQYLQSLLGSEPSIHAFANAYVKNRAAGTTKVSSATAASSASADDSLTFWADVGASSSSAQSKKSKRGRGKPRATASKASNVKQSQKPSFASAVGNVKSSVVSSEQANAIKNAPVEQVRQRIREYRKSKRVVNCIRCGKVENVIRDDGACSFCKAPIFSIWEGDQGHSTSLADEGSSSRSRRSRSGNTRRPSPVVLGRYVYPAELLQSDVDDRSIRVKKLCGNESSKEDEALGKKKVTFSPGLGGFYRNPLIKQEDLEECYAAATQSLTKLAARDCDLKETLPLLCQGRLMIDDISPSVHIYNE